MDGALVDEWYRWIGVAIASLVVLGVATGLPSRASPDAAGVATTVDAVAASDHPATGEHQLTADQIRLGVGTVSLRADGTVATASLAYRTTPVSAGSTLAAVLRGRPASRAFDSPQALDRAASRARDRQPVWRPAGDRLLVRQLVWEDVDVTLVGV